MRGKSAVVADVAEHRCHRRHHYCSENPESLYLISLYLHLVSTN